MDVPGRASSFYRNYFAYPLIISMISSTVYPLASTAAMSRF